MLRFDRYLVMDAHALDLASGHRVELERMMLTSPAPVLFHTRRGRTLIDSEREGARRTDVWEQWVPRRRPPQLEAELTNFAEMLECARHGAPRAFDLGGGDRRDHEYLTRAFGREARIRGWVPIAVELLAALSPPRSRKPPAWMADRSLVIFAQAPGLSGDAVIALLRLARRDARPHVLVRSLAAGSAAPAWSLGIDVRDRVIVHEEPERFALPAASHAHEETADTSRVAGDTQVGADREALARWALLVEDAAGGGAAATRAIELADVLVRREQPFEARALVNAVGPAAPTLAARGQAIVAELRQRAVSSAGERLARTVTAEGGARGWQMVDDFVGVLQMCQDIEDEHTTLARVGAFLRERLQAASVAFVVRESSSSSRVLARVGSEVASADLALRSIETGVAIHPSTTQGPVESACPVRHAAEVIGAVWCRWSAGTPIATEQATTLLGIAAAAAAPSVRLAIARTQPVVPAPNPVPELIGDSLSMVAVRDAIVRAAGSPFPVVIEGESGSGKELVARAIHGRSTRRGRDFCAINCAALVDELVEAELFGHVRGAFTGAANDRPGVFEAASGGTLFLDEVAELGARVQAKLLRTLQEGEIRRVGEAVVRKVDVRLVAATNRPLAKEVAAGKFRADLWYRLDVIRVTLPALRERLEDLPALVGHLWQRLATRTGSRAALSPATVATLAAYDWPGNIRELQNVLASMLVSATRSGLIGPKALPAHIGRVAAFEPSATLADARRQFEERYVRAALAKAGGRTVMAARDLGLSRQGLSKLMGRLGIAEVKGERPVPPNVQ